MESSKARSILLTPDKKFVIVGSKDGRVKIYKFNEKTYAMTYHITFKHAK